jgi:hypothetical protein
VSGLLGRTAGLGGGRRLGLGFNLGLIGERDERRRGGRVPVNQSERGGRKAELETR